MPAKMSKKKSVDKAKIHSMIKAWSRALAARDVQAMMANYAPDVLLFDVKPPFKTNGVAACRRLWEACLPYFPKSFKSQHRDLKITVSGDLAFCHGLHRFQSASEPDHPACQSWFRVTVCYQKIKGRWMAVHEHVSLPFDPMTGRVAFISDADFDND